MNASTLVSWRIGNAADEQAFTCVEDRGRGSTGLHTFTSNPPWSHYVNELAEDEEVTVAFFVERGEGPAPNE